jgi:RNA polymerase sigma-70 factor (ECF subfamily)
MEPDERFIDLYRAEHQRVFRIVYGLTGSRSVAEEAMQDAFAKALERWARLDGQPWVAGWVVRTAVNAGRRAMRHREVPAREVEPQDVEGSIDLWRAVARLPERQQEAVALYYGAELPVAEVAKAMRCREGTVRAHLARARAALRVDLEGADRD